MVKLQCIFLIFLVNAIFWVNCKSVNLKNKSLLANLPSDIDLSILDHTPLSDVLDIGLQIVLPILSQHLSPDEYQGIYLLFNVILFELKVIMLNIYRKRLENHRHS